MENVLRYGNRKYYHKGKGNGRYLTLAELLELSKTKEVKVTDRKSGLDITEKTLLSAEYYGKMKTLKGENV